MVGCNNTLSLKRITVGWSVENPENKMGQFSSRFKKDLQPATPDHGYKIAYGQEHCDDDDDDK